MKIIFSVRRLSQSLGAHKAFLTVGTHSSVPRVRGSYIGTKKFLNFAFEGGKSSPSLTTREDNQIFQEVSEIE
jgi:hypothetical protein